MLGRIAVLLGLVSVVSHAAEVKVSPEDALRLTGLVLEGARMEGGGKALETIKGTLTEAGCVKAEGLCFPAGTRLTLLKAHASGGVAYRLSAVDQPVQLDGVRWQRLFRRAPGVLTSGVLAECWPGPTHLAAGAEALDTCLPAGTTISVRDDGPVRRLAASSAPVTIDGLDWQVLDDRINGTVRGRLARPWTEAGFTWNGLLSREAWPDGLELRGEVASGPLASRWAGEVVVRDFESSTAPLAGWSARGVLLTPLPTSGGAVIGDVSLAGQPLAPQLVSGFSAQPLRVAGYDVPAGALLRSGGGLIVLHRDLEASLVSQNLELVATRQTGAGPDRVLAIASLPNGAALVVTADPMPFAGTTFARLSKVHLLNGEVRRVEGQLLKPHLEPTLSASAGVEAEVTDGCFHFFSARSGGTIGVGTRRASVAHRDSASPNVCSTPWTPIFDDSLE